MTTVGREFLFFGMTVMGGGCAVQGACWCVSRYLAQARNSQSGGCLEVCVERYK